MNSRPRTLYFIVLGAVGLATIVVVLGAYTRLVDAGLGCPDWPGCYGHLGVPSNASDIARAEAAYPDAPVEGGKAWVEMIHRYAATTLGALILLILALSLKGRQPWRLPAGLAVLVIAQGAFGAWTVTLKLWPQVVTAHLLGGFATLALLSLLALTLRPPRLSVDAAWGRTATLALAVVVLQVALGGWLTSNYAALACPDFPACHGDWIPEMDFATGFDITQTVGPNYLGGPTLERRPRRNPLRASPRRDCRAIDRGVVGIPARQPAGCVGARRGSGGTTAARHRQCRVRVAARRGRAAQRGRGSVAGDLGRGSFRRAATVAGIVRR